MLLRIRPYLDKCKDVEDELIELTDDISHQTALTSHCSFGNRVPKTF